MCQDDGDVGPVREIDTMTFDEHTSRQRHVHTTAACSAAHNQTEMTNGAVSEGTLYTIVALSVSVHFCAS